ncbi:MAG: thylakoid membrane photosystem I accumulation factor [Leptolyngbyaceae cyanobacterium]
MRSNPIKSNRWGWQQWLALALVSVVSWLMIGGTALASLDDDRYDGNIFALYAGNGALVPPRMNLTQALAQDKPTLLTFFVDDSADCKRFSSVISQLQAPYGRAANFIAVMADSISFQTSDDPTQAAYYFKGTVPQTLIFDAEGQVRLDVTGEASYEAIDDVMREVFGLLPRSESAELRRAPVNELNSELVEQS